MKKTIEKGILKREEPLPYWYYWTINWAIYGFIFNFTFIMMRELDYMRASAMAGATIIPAAIGGFIGSSLYSLLFKYPFLSVVVSFSMGPAIYAGIASLIVKPINDIHAPLIFYGHPLLSSSSLFISGLLTGIFIAGLNFKKKRSRKSI